ncbi:hypothetical protein ACLMJK_007096 [Lecanora helva]
MAPKRSAIFRDIHITQAFFGQTPPCSCKGPCPHTVGDSSKSASSSANPCPDSSSQTTGESSKSATSSAKPRSKEVPDPRANPALKHLSDEAKEEMKNAFPDDPDAYPDHFKTTKNLARALDVLIKQQNETIFKAEAFKPMSSYDLGHLDDVVTEYDKAYLMCEQIEEPETQELSDLVFAETSSSDHRLNLMQRSVGNSWNRILCLNEITVNTMQSFYRKMRLFNVEKRFGFLAEELKEIVNHSWVDEGDDPKKVLPKALTQSCRQLFDNPENLLPLCLDKRELEKVRFRDMLKQKQKKPNRSLLSPLDTYQQRFKELVELVTAENKRDYVKPTGVESSSKQAADIDFGLDPKIPKRIRQRLFDLDFVTEEIEVLTPVVVQQRDKVRSNLKYWSAASPETWQYGKKHIHEMPTMRRYEHSRISLQALHVVAVHEWIRVARFFNSKRGSPLLTPTLVKTLDWSNDLDFQRTLMLIGPANDIHCGERQFQPVASMVTDIDETWEQLTELLKNHSPEEVKSLMERQDFIGRKNRPKSGMTAQTS